LSVLSDHAETAETAEIVDVTVARAAIAVETVVNEEINSLLLTQSNLSDCCEYKKIREPITKAPNK
jgi:hypothetical protein